MRAIDIIRRKRDGAELSKGEIESFVRSAVDGSWEDYQLSAMLMAIYLQGMSPTETAELTACMTNSGTRYRWDAIPGPKVDKHSTGGVGDKTSLILAPLAAACGVIVPMMSGRGLGHTGGTLDKLEAIPGFRIDLSEAELANSLRSIGVGMIGQSSAIAPADQTLYALRDVTSTVESIPLITASILSKKLAEGIDALVMDVKVGRGAFMKTLDDARALARSIVSVGNANGVRTEAMITSMDAPLGRRIGNSLEVRESIECLQGKGPKDLADLSITLAARMVVLGKLATDEAEAISKVRAALDSGAGLEKFRQIVRLQGGDERVIDEPSRLPRAPKQYLFRATRNGYVVDLHAEKIGIAAMLLGAGRSRADARIDPAVGITIRTLLGEEVRSGDPILELHYRDEVSLAAVLGLLNEAVVIGDRVPKISPIVVEQIR